MKLSGKSLAALIPLVMTGAMSCQGTPSSVPKSKANDVVTLPDGTKFYSVTSKNHNAGRPRPEAPPPRDFSHPGHFNEDGVFVFTPETVSKFRPVTPRRPKFGQSDVQPGQVSYGAGISSYTPVSGGYTAVQAAHSIYDGLTFSSASQDRLLYAPTLLGPNGCPLEVVTAYYRPANSSSMSRWVGVWDHALTWPGNWGPNGTRNMNDGSMGNYTYYHSTYGLVYYTFIDEGFVNGSNAWRAWLWNFQTGGWELLYSRSRNSYNCISGTSATNCTVFNDGWDFHEFYWNNTGCPTLPSIRAAEIFIWYNGSSGARLATDSTSPPGANAYRINNPSTCPSYTRTYPSPISHWVQLF